MTAIMAFRTEDQVRNEAGITLCFIDSIGNNFDTSEYLSGVGQLTTFIREKHRHGTLKYSVLRPREVKPGTTVIQICYK